MYWIRNVLVIFLIGCHSVMAADSFSDSTQVDEYRPDSNRSSSIRLGLSTGADSYSSQELAARLGLDPAWQLRAGAKGSNDRFNNSRSRIYLGAHKKNFFPGVGLAIIGDYEVIPNMNSAGAFTTANFKAGDSVEYGFTAEYQRVAETVGALASVNYLSFSGYVDVEVVRSWFVSVDAMSSPTEDKGNLLRDFIVPKSRLGADVEWDYSSDVELKVRYSHSTYYGGTAPADLGSVSADFQVAPDVWIEGYVVSSSLYGMNFRYLW